MGRKPDGVGGLVQSVQLETHDHYGCRSRVAHRQLSLVGSFADIQERNTDEHHR